MTADPIGSFTFSIPLSHIFGFFEYDKVLYNLEHTLSFTRGSNSIPVYKNNATADRIIKLTDIRWLVPEITPSPVMRMNLLELVKHKTEIPIHFSGRSDDHTIVNQNVRSFDWMLNSSVGIEKPRWIIFSLQTDKG